MIKVFKFGGASVKDAEAVRNVSRILRKFAPAKLVVVVSAMGKTTNALENALNAWYNNDPQLGHLVEDVISYHETIIKALFADEHHPVYFKTSLLFGQLESYVDSPPTQTYDLNYDQLVSLGELISSVIVGEFLAFEGFNCRLFDVRELIRTDDTWREGKVDWEVTSQQINEDLGGFFSSNGQPPAIALTQGFLGATEQGLTTTLGREGSDYTAAIFSHVLNALEMTVWKDVPGILNADPKHFANTSLLNHISYREAIELTYYGASVIHPKTIKPLQNKNIPLRVRSFVQPEAPGTLIGNYSEDDDKTASIILKSDQALISFSPKDFSFIAEDNLSEILSAMATCGLRANMMQSSAISFSVCVDENETKMQKLFELLGENFGYRYNNGLQLITIRHFDTATIARVLDNRQLLMEQRNRQTAQFVVKEKVEDQ